MDPIDPDDFPTDLAVTKARYRAVRRICGEALQAFHEDKEWAAYDAYLRLESEEEKLGFWQIMRPHPALRSCIKRWIDHESDRPTRSGELHAEELGGSCGGESSEDLPGAVHQEQEGPSDEGSRGPSSQCTGT